MIMIIIMITIIQFSGIYYQAGLTAQVLIMKPTHKANTTKKEYKYTKTKTLNKQNKNNKTALK